MQSSDAERRTCVNLGAGADAKKKGEGPFELIVGADR